VQKLANAAYEKRIRTSPIEMHIVPSIGLMGHGTSPETFQAGAEWMQQELLS